MRTAGPRQRPGRGPEEGTPGRIAVASVVRTCARVPNDLMLVAGELHRPDLDGELVKLAGEAEGHLIVLVVNGGTGIDTHVEGFLDGNDERNGVRDLVGGDLLLFHLQDARAALAEAGSIVFEVEHDGVLARCKRVLAFPAEAFEIEEVVDEHWLALEQIQAIATEASAFSDDHSFAAVLRAGTPNGAARATRNVHFGGERIRPVQDAGR